MSIKYASNEKQEVFIYRDSDKKLVGEFESVFAAVKHFLPKKTTKHSSLSSQISGSLNYRPGRVTKRGMKKRWRFSLPIDGVTTMCFALKKKLPEK